MSDFIFVTEPLTPMNRYRVLLAEDHPLMCDEIASVLSREHELIAIVRIGTEIIPTAEQLSPEVIVLDISMPGRSGLQILPELRVRMPAVPIIVLTAHSEPIYVEEAFCRGANGFVLKGNLMKDLLPTIRAALERQQEP
jgi:DNA-binding NarL/FixJ family response regulator